MSQSQKTGGNKKTASPSDERYQQRRQQGNLDAVHKAKNIARHKKRMMKKAAHRVVWAAKRVQKVTLEIAQ